MRIAFWGSGEFASTPLRYLAEREDIAVVITTPDKRGGRGRSLISTPVKLLAKELGKRILQPESLKDGSLVDVLSDVELGVVVDYGKFIPSSLYRLPRFGTINLHPSLLPRYRGAAPIRWVIINGDEVTGNTVFFLAKRMDAGDILLQEEEPVFPDDTYGTLFERLSTKGARLLEKAIEVILTGRYTLRKQDEKGVSYARKLSSSDTEIDWGMSAEVIDRWVRAMNPSPGMFFYWNGRRIKVWSVAVVKEDGSLGEPGMVISVGKRGPIVSTGSGCVELLEVQPAGKRNISGVDFLNGYRVKIGDSFCLGGRVR